MLFNALAVIIYAITCLYIIKIDKRGFIFFLMLSFTQLWAVASCFYNDLGIYNIELVRYTEPTYATFRLAALYITFNLGFLFMAKMLKNSFLTNVDYKVSKESLKLGSIKISVYGAIGLIIIYIGYTFITEGIPIFSGFGRLAYFEEASRLEQFLVFSKVLIAFLLGYYRRDNKPVTVNGIILFVFLLYLVLTGNKFSTLRLVLFCYYAPIFARYLYNSPNMKMFKKKYLVIAVISIVALMGLSYGTYSWKMGDFGIAGTYLQNRILAFQGEMWWAADYDYHNSDLYDKAHWKTELDAIISPDEVSSEEVGMKYLMIKLLGPEKAHTVIDTGYLFTMAYPGILITMFPFPVVFVIQFFAGIFFCVLLYYLYYSIVYKHVFRSIVSMVVVIPFVTVLATGNFFVFFTFGMLIKILILILLEIGDFRNKINKGTA